jgi:hypothetical protein
MVDGPSYGKEPEDWGVSDKDMEAATLEGRVWGTGGPNGEGESTPATLKRLFRENSVQAAMNIVTIANHGTTERVRYDASKYIIERVLGPLGLIKDSGTAEKGTLEYTMEQIANGGGE